MHTSGEMRRGNAEVCPYANQPRQKIVTIFLRIRLLREGELPMRKACAILVGSIATLAVLATPALAKSVNATTAEAPKADDPSAPPACHSYVQTPEGEWKPAPCQELGAEARTPKKHAGGNADAAH
jgi:hypothetical protein